MKRSAELISAPFLAIILGGCATVANSPTVQITNEIASQIASTYGTMLEPAVRDQVAEEWDTHLGSDSRLAIESVASVILNMPGLTEDNRVQLYRNYVSCGAGLVNTSESGRQANRRIELTLTPIEAPAAG